MAPDTKTDGAAPAYVLSSFEIARRLKQRFDNANQAGAAMPQFARALVYKMWEGGANVTQDTLLRFTEALEALPDAPPLQPGDVIDSGKGLVVQRIEEDGDVLVLNISEGTEHYISREAAARCRVIQRGGGAGGVTPQTNDATFEALVSGDDTPARRAPHPGDDGLTIDPADGDAPTPDSTEEAI